jgi:hypothetical protein
MGNKNSAAAASAITHLLVVLSLHFSQAQHILYDIIIDDVLFVARDYPNLHAVLYQFDSICASFSVTIGASTEISNTEVTHRGITFDLIQKTQRLKTQYLQKFSQRWNEFRSRPSLAKAISLVGMIAYAAQVIFIPSLPSVFRAYARIIAEDNKEVIKSLVDDFASAATTIIANEPRHLESAEDMPFAGYCISDATPTTLAFIFVNAYGHVTADTRRIDNTITHVAEGMASIEAMQLLPNYSVTHRVHVIGDNQPWLYAIDPTRGATPAMETLRAQFWEVAKVKNVVPTCLFVPSEFNCTDAASRDQANRITIDQTINNATSLAKKRNE